jgi:hypothetical protein
MSLPTTSATSAYTYTSGMRAINHPAIAWLRGALVLAIAGQLITVSALCSAYPLSASWSAPYLATLLLAIAPAPLAALAVIAAFAARQPGEQRYAQPTTALTVVVLLVGMIGGVTHTGLFFLPELAVLGIATRKLWRESGKLEA